MASVSNTSANASCRTLVLKHNVTFDWTIENFMDCPHDVGDSLTSSIFYPSTLPETGWRLVIYPVGEAQDNNDIAIYLEKCNKGRLKVKGSTHYETTKRKLITDFAVVMIDDKVRIATLEQRYVVNNYLNNGNLIIHCDLTISKLDDVVSYPTDYHPGTNTVEDTMHELTLGFELKKFFQKNKLSDFILKVGAEEFCVHKFMLAARSKVFEAMFEHDTKEMREGRAEIRDIHPSVIESMLEYIYSARVNVSSVELALRLYDAAEKYDIVSLKEKCLKYLFYNLNSSNAVGIYLLAETYNVQELKIFSQNYIYSNTTAILESESWKKLAKIRPGKAVDILNDKVQ